MKYCPEVRNRVEAIRLYKTGKWVEISEALCSGCGICPHKCPFGAISIINLELNLDYPIHQYGENRFRLFRLPVIRDSETVGLIGKNGIGKSTIVKILAGQVIPNLGDYSHEPNLDRVIDFYRGKEMQKVFVALKENKYSFQG